MTRDELKQKLMVARGILAREYSGISAGSTYETRAHETGFSQLLPLLLDAYEALDKVGAGAVCRVITPKEEHGQILDNCLKISAEILARIEAFANGEK